MVILHVLLIYYCPRRVYTGAGGGQDLTIDRGHYPASDATAAHQHCVAIAELLQRQSVAVARGTCDDDVPSVVIGATTAAVVAVLLVLVEQSSHTLVGGLDMMAHSRHTHSH